MFYRRFTCKTSVKHTFYVRKTIIHDQIIIFKIKKQSTMIDFSFLKTMIERVCPQEYESESLSFELYQIGIEKALKQMSTKEEKINYLKNEMLQLETKVYFNNPLAQVFYNTLSDTDEGKVHIKILESKIKNDAFFNLLNIKTEWMMGKLQQAIVSDDAQMEVLQQEVSIEGNIFLADAFSEIKETIETAKDNGEVGSFKALADKQRLETVKPFFDVNNLQKIAPTIQQRIVSLLFYGDNIKPYLLDKIEGIIAPVPVQGKEQPPQGEKDTIVELPKGYRKLAPRFSDEELWKFISFLFKETNKSDEPFLSEDDTKKLFKYGLVIPPAQLEQPFKLNLGVDKSNDKTTIYSIFYEFYCISQKTGTKKDAIAAFLFRHFDNFDTENSIYDALRKGDLGFEIEPYKPIPKKLQ
jgi:hypothetical protein